MDREQQKDLVRRRWEQKRRARRRWAYVVKEVWGYNYRDWQYVLYGEKLFEWAENQIRYGWKNPRRCSCWMCRNERKTNGTRTRQEKKFFDQMRDELLSAEE